MSDRGDGSGNPLPAFVAFGAFMLFSLWPNISPLVRHPCQALSLFVVSLGGAPYLQRHERVGAGILGIAFLMILAASVLPLLLWISIELTIVATALLTMYGKNPGLSAIFRGG